MNIVYEIMHKDRRVASIDEKGNGKVYFRSFMPYNLYLESGNDVNTLVDNITNFQYWCATRVLTLDRQYAKELLNSAGLSQAVTDKERAQIALSYRCLSITDVFWVKKRGEKVKFADINLYENHLDKTFVDIALQGRQYTVQNEYLARDLSTNGCFPKAWRRTENGFQLLKDGGEDVVKRELLASRICRCFDVNQVLYEESFFENEKVTVSENITSLDYGLVPLEYLEIYLDNREQDEKKYILRLDKKNYYMMNIVDYLIGNTDRHWGNWGVLVNNQNNRPIRLYDLMDFNQSFHSYDTLDGANCLTLFHHEKATQREAAVYAVQKIGLNQIFEIDWSCFDALPEYREMFAKRLQLLKKTEEEKRQERNCSMGKDEKED